MSHQAGFDAIVIGAGHNGLTTAALLAKAGRRVVVLERRPFIGGTAAAEEFHPGYRSAGLFHESTAVRSRVISDLQLARHGLVLRSEPPDMLALGTAGRGLLLCGERSRAAAEIREVSPLDAQRYLEFCSLLDRLGPLLDSFADAPPLDLVRVESNRVMDLLARGLRLRRLGRKAMLELLRLPPMAVIDWLREWFETDLLLAALALPAIRGTFLGPRSPSSNANLLWSRAARGSGLVGGGPMLVAALEKSARALGVEVRTSSPVKCILHDHARVHGVSLEDGGQIDAPIVAASCDPKHALLDLLPPGSLSHQLEHRIRKFRTRGTTAQVLLALDRPLCFSCQPAREIEFAATVESPDRLERAFDAVKYRRVSPDPILDIYVPTVAAPELAPAHHAVVSILVHFTPHDLDPPWDSEQREQLGDRVVEILAEHAPDVRASVVARRILAPPDLALCYNLTGGQIHHGEQTLDQLLIRPAPECCRYATPLGGLYLCGSGSHPGGGLTCAPGAFAASAILEAAKPA